MLFAGSPTQGEGGHAASWSTARAGLMLAGDGRSDWLKGIQLLAVYLILGLAFFFVPSPSPR
jgi:hypothetical protein